MELSADHDGLRYIDTFGYSRVRMSVDYPSYIRREAWDGGGMTKLLQLQGALDDMHGTYNRVRDTILSRLSNIAGDLDGTGKDLRESADEYEQTDKSARDELQLWP